MVMGMVVMGMGMCRGCVDLHRGPGCITPVGLTLLRPAPDYTFGAGRFRY